MKKITLLAVAFVAVSFASCKKDRTCTCTTTTTYGSTTYTSMSATHAKTSKKSAEAWCSANQSAVYSDNTGSISGVTQPTCKIN